MLNYKCVAYPDNETEITEYLKEEKPNEIEEAFREILLKRGYFADAIDEMRIEYTKIPNKPE